MTACPERCSTCKDGATWDGGKVVNNNGYCEHYCSKWGYCGDGEKYKIDPSAICYGCVSEGKRINHVVDSSILVFLSKYNI